MTVVTVGVFIMLAVTKLRRGSCMFAQHTDPGRIAVRSFLYSYKSTRPSSRLPSS